jgi:GWxTD domain-containing protein
MRHVALAIFAVTVFAGALASQPPYQKWFDEDVAYIITGGERQTFQHLNTDAEREQFIQEFWSRRNPAPGQTENPLKEEHYRRIAFANEHFGAGITGWKTDRGRVYIVLGPPDEIESHSANPPKELWRYTYVNGVGHLELEFADPSLTGEYRLSLGSAERDALLNPRVEAARVVMYSAKAVSPTVVVTGSIGNVTISIPVPGNAPVTIYGRVADATNRHAVQVFEETTREPGPVYQKAILLPLGSYHLTTVARDASGNAVERECAFEVK